jgi:hypothetical protein
MSKHGCIPSRSAQQPLHLSGYIYIIYIYILLLLFVSSQSAQQPLRLSGSVAASSRLNLKQWRARTSEPSVSGTWAFVAAAEATAPGLPSESWQRWAKRMKSTQAKGTDVTWEERERERDR